MMIIMIITIMVSREIYLNISAIKARKNFGELLNRVLLKDEENTLEKSAKEVAKLIKVRTPAINNINQGKLNFRKSRGLGKETWYSQIKHGILIFIIRE